MAKPKIKPYKSLKLEPSARVFHYGQADVQVVIVEHFSRTANGDVGVAKVTVVTPISHFSQKNRLRNCTSNKQIFRPF